MENGGRASLVDKRAEQGIAVVESTPSSNAQQVAGVVQALVRIVQVRIEEPLHIAVLEIEGTQLCLKARPIARAELYERVVDLLVEIAIGPESVRRIAELSDAVGNVIVQTGEHCVFAERVVACADGRKLETQAVRGH